ncbi:MAG: 2-phosphosulfolactate phosphatase [Ignavibacteria bacterium]|nr:2-phosphosulfolactate phosphatase [Ignavibacteria bacterium]
MRVDFHFTPHQADEIWLRNKDVVIIDVLRSSTTIATSLRNGAKEIIPVASVERAVKVSGNLFGDAILRGGERNGRMIDGFNLGNSPAEYTEEKVKGKGIIFSTTNGTLAIERARFARALVVCGFVNISTVAAFLRTQGRDFVILCSGRNGMFSLEDTVCAGMLLRRMMDNHDVEIELSDGALAAVHLHKSLGKNIMKLLRASEHGRYLIQIGFEDDLSLCAGVDTVPVLPRLVGGVIRLNADPGVQVTPAA